MLTKSNDHCEQNIVVVETSSIFNNNVPLISKQNISVNYSVDFTNSVPIESTFIKHDETTYSILNKKCILNDLVLNKHITIPSIGIVNGINLIDFPIGQYTLNINGLNLATAKYDTMHTTTLISDKLSNISKKHSFNIASSESDLMNIFKNVAIGDNEPTILNRSEYLNLHRIDLMRIIVPKNIILPEKCTIELNGYFEENHIWKNSLSQIDIYPYDTYNLNLNKITESIDITANCRGTVIIIINDIKYTIPIGPMPTRISFNNTNKMHFGIQNKFLPESINSHTINFSGINLIQFIVLDCKIIELYQNYYETYSYPERKCMFV